jgi:hypothetical protein
LVEVRNTLALRHKIGGLVLVPGSLRFIEHRDTFNRSPRVPKIGVAKVMNVLDEAFDLAGGIGLGDRLPSLFGLRLFVAREGFTLHVDERPVA